MKKNKQTIILTILFASSYLYAASDPAKKTYTALELTAQTIAKIEERSFRKGVDILKLVQEALKDAIPMVVDAHSGFFPPKSYESMKNSASGEFPGIGISVTGKMPQDPGLVIESVIYGGPAHKAGLKGRGDNDELSGIPDIIEEVDGKKIKGLSTDEVINTLLKGKIGTKVDLKIRRGKQYLNFTLTREIIKEQTSLCYHFKQQNVYYISLRMFTQKASDQVSKLLKQANNKKCTGIVLDLRRNPGGVLDSAIDMSGLFIDKNSLVVTTKDRNGQTISEYRTKTRPILQSDVPIFVLIDNFTASASEILAETLRFYSSKNKTRSLMAFLVGSPTFGKGSVQEVIPLTNGCALKLTTMIYCTPNGKSPQAVGVKPDFHVTYKIAPEKEIKFIKEFYGKESSLPNYITEEEVEKINQSNPKRKHKKKEKEKTETETEEQEKTWEEKKLESIKKDPVIQSSVNMIKMLEIAKKLDSKKVNTREKALAFLQKHYVTDDSTDIEKI